MICANGGVARFYQNLHRYRIASSLIHTHSFFSTSASLLVKKRMPPKKAAAPEKKTLLGRPSNNLKIGIVGLFCTFRPFRTLTSFKVFRTLESPLSSMYYPRRACFLSLPPDCNLQPDQTSERLPTSRMPL